jgi:hypothetical protein
MVGVHSARPGALHRRQNPIASLARLIGLTTIRSGWLVRGNFWWKVVVVRSPAVSSSSMMVRKPRQTEPDARR